MNRSARMLGQVITSGWLMCASCMSHAEIILQGGVETDILTFVPGTGFVSQGVSNTAIAGDGSSYDSGLLGILRVRESPGAGEDPLVTVNGGSTLFAGLGVRGELPAGTFSGPIQDSFALGRVLVDGVGSRLELGTSATPSRGSILLGGKTDLEISNGATVGWADNNTCGVTGPCGVLIGAFGGFASGGNGASNAGVVVDGVGSLLDASNTGGDFIVGAVQAELPSTVPGDDFLVILNGGEVRSNGGDVADGENNPGWVPADGEVQANVVIDAGSWNVQAQGGAPTNFDIGEGNGASGNVFIQNGGQLNITANAGQEAGIFIGQDDVGNITRGGSNLLVISGVGSSLNVDSNASVFNGSRTANGFVTVEDGATFNLDSTALVISGNSGAVLSDFNANAANNPDTPLLNYADLSNNNLDVRSGGSVVISDSDGTGFSTLVIGQTPGDGPTESASVRVTGAGSNISVTNAVGLALDATEFGLPVVSNIGTGTLDIADGGAVNIVNGDFVIAARAGDAAVVTVAGADSSLNADRVIVGLSDFEGAGVAAGASSGTLTLEGGVVNGDVIVDANGILNGIGTINGTLFAEGGVIDPGFSPGTIVVEALVLGAGAQLLLEVGINADGTIDPTQSDAIIATAGAIDLIGEVIFAFDALFDDTNTAVTTDLIAGLNIGSLFAVQAGQTFGFDPLMASFAVAAVDGNSAPTPIMNISADQFDFTPVSVPEPGSLALLALGLAALMMRRRSRHL